MRVDMKLLRTGGRKLLTVKTHPTAFGHMCLDVLMSLHVAHQIGAAVHFSSAGSFKTNPLHRLVCDRVEVLKAVPSIKLRVGFFSFLDSAVDLAVAAARSARTGFLALRWGSRVLFWGVSEGCRSLRNLWIESVQSALRWVWKRPDVSKTIRVWLKERAGDQKVLPPVPAPVAYQFADLLEGKMPALDDSPLTKPYFGSYFRRLAADEKLLLRLDPADEGKARETLEHDFGIGPADKIVTLHVRESGYKANEEAPDSIRNADVETYADAVHRLTAQGYKVVRIGDPSMKPVRWPGVVDMATSPARSSLAEIACLLRSCFFVGCESGPYAASMLLGVPALLVNAVGHLTSFPLHDKSLCILKHVRDHHQDRALSLREVLTEEYMATREDLTRYTYIDNSAKEIFDAVEEMEASWRGPVRETAEQRVYREMALDLCRCLAKGKRFQRKWGLDPVFLGRGRIASGYVSKYLETGLSRPLEAVSR